MANFRSALVIFLGVLALAQFAASQSHTIEVGYREPSDRLVAHETVFKNRIILWVSEEEKMITLSPDMVITQVRAIDMKGNGNGATATIIAGGPGQNFVTLRFVSARGHSIRFTVDVYGKPSGHYRPQ